MAAQTTQSSGSGGGLPSVPTGAESIVGAMATGAIPIPSMTGGAAAPSGSEGYFSNRSPVNIAPVGVNLGAILQPFNQGAPENGGYGLDLMSRYVENKYGARETAISIAPSTSIPYVWIMVALGGAGALIFILKKRGS